MDDASARDLVKLERIARRSDVFQRFSDAAIGFRDALSRPNFLFNRCLSLDLMEIDKATDFQAVDRNTKLSDARFLRSDSTLTVWDMFFDL